MCYFVRICSKGADLTVNVARALLQLVFLTSVLFVSPEFYFVVSMPL